MLEYSNESSTQFSMSKFQKGHKINVGKKRTEVSRTKQSVRMTGKNNPMYGETQTEKARKKIKRRLKLFYQNGGINGMKGKKHTEAAKEKNKLKHLGKKYLNRKSPPLFSEERILKMREYRHTEAAKQKIRNRNIEHPNKKFTGTKIELKMREELDKRDFIKDVDYFCNIGLNKIANVDIYLPALNTIIECDGCLYHACKQCGFTKYYQEVPIVDMRKTRLLEEAGYKVYRFWEHSITKSPEECINKIFKEHAIST